MRRDPFKDNRLPRDVILIAIRWYCRFPLSYGDARDPIAERGIDVDPPTVFRWVQKSGPEITRRALDRRSWSRLDWQLIRKLSSPA